VVAETPESLRRAPGVCAAHTTGPLELFATRDGARSAGAACPPRMPCTTPGIANPWEHAPCRLL